MAKVLPGEDFGGDEERRRAAGEGARRFRREVQSDRRLAQAWAERDKMLDGEGGEVKGEDAGKTFECKHPGCSATFSSQQALAGHVGAHKRAGSRRRTKSGGRARPPGGKPRFKCRYCEKGFDALHAIAEHVRVAHRGSVPQQGAPQGAQQIPCPVCARPLPAAAAVVVRAFQGKGIAQAEAEHLAAIAWGLLHVHERTS